MLFDSTFVILLPALLLSFWAQMKIKSTFDKYNKIFSSRGYTGAQVARMLLDCNDLYDVPIEVVSGKLTDHYDPAQRVMRLSSDIFYGTSVAAIGVAAHETGHAIQHKAHYVPLMARNSIVPVVNFSSQLSWILFFLGMVMRFAGLINLGIVLFTAVVIFQVITLPVEFNASKRALVILEEKNILFNEEIKGARAVLNAAAMTYVAAALMAISQLLRLLAISNRNRN